MLCYVHAHVGHVEIVHDYNKYICMDTAIKIPLNIVNVNHLVSRFSHMAVLRTGQG